MIELIDDDLQANQHHFTNSVSKATKRQENSNFNNQFSTNILPKVFIFHSNRLQPCETNFPIQAYREMHLYLIIIYILTLEQSTIYHHNKQVSQSPINLRENFSTSNFSLVIKEYTGPNCPSEMWEAIESSYCMNASQQDDNLKIIQIMDIEKTFEQLLEEKDAKIKDAEENFGETEVRDAVLAKAELYNDHGKYPEAIETYNLALKRTIEIGKKMDIAFKLIGIYLRLENNHKIKENIDQCYKLLEKGGDWERKNKLKVYEGIYRLIVRDFTAASKLFVDVLPTFNCPEVMSYEKLVTYSVLTGILNMDRVSIKKKILDSSQAIVYLMKLPDIKDYLESFYYCRYRSFFQVFVRIIDLVKSDPYLHHHTRYFIRETRVIIYSQFLESYKTVKLESMANEFGVSLDFIDRELSELISARRLPCKIDKVAGIIETDPTDERNRLYKNAVKKGDHLLNQIQKLSRAIDL